jgi:hypothetical protein
MIVNLKLAAKAQGDFASKKVTNGWAAFRLKVLVKQQNNN